MNEDLNPLLEENLRLARDTNRMLRAMRRDAWFSFFGKILLWAAVIVVPFYFYAIYLAPLMESVSSLIPGSGTQGGGGGLFGLPTSPSELQKLIEQYKVE